MSNTTDFWDSFATTQWTVNATKWMTSTTSATTDGIFNSTEPYHFTEDQNGTVLTVISYIIAIVSSVTICILLLLFLHYLYLKLFHPREFYVRHIIGRPSQKLLYYLQASHLFLTLSRFYILIAQLFTWIPWSSYCSHYRDDLYGSWDHDRCEQDAHCFVVDYESLGYSVCIPWPPKIDHIMISNVFLTVLNFFILFFHYFQTWVMEKEDDINDTLKTHADSLCLRCRKDKETLQQKYEQQRFFRFSWAIFVVWSVTIIWFFVITTDWSYAYNGPGVNYAPWWVPCSAGILAVLNEIIKYGVYRVHLKYNEETVIVYLLNDVFGETIGKMIWVEFAGRFREIEEDTDLKMADFNTDIAIELQTKLPHKK